MTKKIILLNNSAVFDDRSEYVVSNNEELEFELMNNYANSKAYLIFNDNCYFMKDNKIKLENLKTGILRCIIEIRDCDTVIKKYSVEPLKIVKLEEEYKVIPEIEELRKQVEEIKPVLKQIKELKNSVKSLAKAVLKVIKVGGEE